MKGNAIFACAGLCLATVLAACSGTSSAPPREIDGKVYSTETKVFYSKKSCVFAPGTLNNPLLLALATAIIPAVISAGTTFVGNELGAQAAPAVDKSEATQNVNVADGKLPLCVQIVRGRFAPTTKARSLGEMSDQPGDVPSWFSEMVNAGFDHAGVSVESSTVEKAWENLVATNRQSGVTIVDRPDFMFEGLVRRSANGAAIAVAPLFASFDQPLKNRTLRSGTREVSVVVFLVNPAKAEKGMTINLGQMMPGYVSALNVGSVLSIEKAVQEAPNEVAEIRFDNESVWVLPELEANGPAVVKVAVLEATDKSEMLAFFAEVLKASKPAVDKALSDAALRQLPPTEEQRLAEDTKEITASKEYATARAAALAALYECSLLPKPLPQDIAGKVALDAKLTAAGVAQANANLAAQKAGQSAVFGRSDIVAPGDQPTKCGEVLQNVVG